MPYVFTIGEQGGKAIASVVTGNQDGTLGVVSLFAGRQVVAPGTALTVTAAPEIYSLADFTDPEAPTDQPTTYAAYLVVTYTDATVAYLGPFLQINRPQAFVNANGEVTTANPNVTQDISVSTQPPIVVEQE